MSIKIVSRHPGAIAWIKSKGFEGEQIAQFTPEMAQEGDTVIGVLPVPLIASVLNAGAQFILLSLPAVAFSERGQELTPDQMDAAGAKLHRITDICMEEI